jgi:hypothetical protein
MAINEVTAFLDSAGAMHRLKEDALLSDLERAVGKIGNGEGLTQGIARKLVDNRDEIIELLGQFGPAQPCETREAA